MIKVIVFSALIPLVFSGASPNYSVSRAKVLRTKSTNPYVTTYTAFPEQIAVRAGPGPSRAQNVPTFSPQFPVLPRVVPVQAPVTVPFNVVRNEPYDSNPQYNFAYQVHDSISGTNHGHSEARDGDVVKGQYSVLDPDGFLRTVTYTSDPVNGFNAVVDRQPQTLLKQGPVAIQGPVHVQPQHTLPHQGTPVTPKLQYSFSYATPAVSYGYSF